MLCSVQRSTRTLAHSSDGGIGYSSSVRKTPSLMPTGCLAEDAVRLRKSDSLLLLTAYGRMQDLPVEMRVSGDGSMWEWSNVCPTFFSRSQLHV